MGVSHGRTVRGELRRIDRGYVFLVSAILLAAVLYFGGVILLGALKKEDISRLPVVGRLLKESK